MLIYRTLSFLDKSVLRSQYGQLTDEDKLIWITKAVKEMKEVNNLTFASTVIGIIFVLFYSPTSTLTYQHS